jgi:hypothetical protein
MMRTVLLLSAVWVTNVASFTAPLPTSSAAVVSTTTAISRRLPSLFSEPSDTSSDNNEEMYIYEDAVDTVSQSYEPSAGESAVSSIMDLMPSQLSGDVSDETRSAINEALLKLERLNPTADPAVSPLLNGVWELKYVGGYATDWALPSPTRQLALFLYSGGYSPGVFALALAQKLPAALVEVGDLVLSISREQPRVEASIDVKLLGGGIKSSVKVKTRLEAQSSVRLKETYESATVIDQSVPIPDALKYSRDLYVTYVDEDLLVVRDASGVPEVCTRKGATFTTSAMEPDSLDGLTPPGTANGEA